MKQHEKPDDLFRPEPARSLLERLLRDSRLYNQSNAFKELLDFTARMRNFAPFNAMLLQIQKPGLRFAASAYEWREHFGRKPIEGARPLLILWPFGPVVFVYDLMDTEGRELPRDAWAFYALGPVDAERIASFRQQVQAKNIEWIWIDAGDNRAGSIQVIIRGDDKKEPTVYRMQVNRNHMPAMQFNTLAHELAHLFLGHLGPDKALTVPDRVSTDDRQRAIEAESVAYLVCTRNGVVSASESYLTEYVHANTTLGHIDIYQIMRAAGQIEALLGLTAQTRFDKPR